MGSHDKTMTAIHYASAFAWLLIDHVHIFVAIDQKMREMAAERNQTQEIQKYYERLKAQLEVINRVCLSKELNCLDTTDQKKCAVRIDTMLGQMSHLLNEIGQLDKEIKKRDNSWGQWFADIGVATSLMVPNWKQRHTNCINTLTELQKDIDAISTVSIQIILEKVTILTRTVTQMGRESRAGGNRHLDSRLSNRAHRHSTFNPSGPNSAPGHPSSYPNSFYSSGSDYTQTAREYGEEGLLRRIRDHSTHLWDWYVSLLNHAKINPAELNLVKLVKYGFAAKVAGWI